MRCGVWESDMGTDVAICSIPQRAAMQRAVARVAARMLALAVEAHWMEERQSLSRVLLSLP